MKLTKIILLGLILAVASFLGFYVYVKFNVLKLPEEESGLGEDNSGELFVGGLENMIGEGPKSDRYWYRDPETDLPLQFVTIRADVENTGRKREENVEVVIKVNADVIFSEFRDFNIGQDIFFHLNTSIRYNRSVVVSITLWRNGSLVVNGDNEIINPHFPRETPILEDPQTAQLYITPKYVEILETRDRIVANISEHWVAIADWVESNISYLDDKGSDRWQLSHETLDLRQGDDEDMAILLCSLLRADGFADDEVYVVWGMDGNVSRCQCALKIPDGEGSWMRLEPKIDGFLRTEFESYDELIDTILTEIERLYVFNDVHVYALR
jgi:hypothetical protein